MCPGGQVFAAASEPGGVVTNGMRGADVGGNPPVNQRDREKDKDREKLKRPYVAL